MHRDDGAQGGFIGEADVVEKAAAQKGIGQLFFVVRGDNDNRAMRGADRLAGLVDVELHPVEFLQEVVGELDIGLVDLVDQQNHAARRLERLPQLALADVVFHVIDARIAQLAVAQAADGVVFVEALLRLRGGFHMPLDQWQTKAGRDLSRQFGLARAGFALHQQRAFQRYGGVYGKGQVVGGHIGGSRGKFHNTFRGFFDEVATTLTQGEIAASGTVP